MKNLSPKSAYSLLQQDSDAVLIDCRSFTEYWLVGHPTMAVNICWNDENWDLNPNFIDEVKARVQAEGMVILLCRSGKRTIDAGAALEREGFTNVAHVDTGFEGELDQDKHRSSVNGWRLDGLPWVQG